MWDFMKKQEDECSRFRDSLEEVASGGASREMLEHSAACEDCAAAAEELLESRELLRALPRESSPSDGVVCAACDGGDCGARGGTEAVIRRVVGDSEICVAADMDYGAGAGVGGHVVPAAAECANEADGDRYYR